MAKLEAHITVDKEFAAQTEEVGNEYSWKFSVIAGCPILGQGTYCYLTSYDDNVMRLHDRMQHVCIALERRKVPVLRSKIEHIVFDTKTGVNELGL